jgi:hypothetical protein
MVGKNDPILGEKKDQLLFEILKRMPTTHRIMKLLFWVKNIKHMLKQKENQNAPILGSQK